MIKASTPARPLWGGIAGALLSAAAGAALFLFPLGDGLARLSYDLPFLLRHQVPQTLVLVYLDRETKVALGEPLDQPLALHYHTRLLRQLSIGQARLILYDILFDQQEEDEIRASGFLEALPTDRPVVLVAGFDRWREDHFVFETPLMPVPLLREAAAGVGLARLSLDPDLSVRRIDPGTEMLPSASWIAASLVEEPDSLNPATRLAPRWLNYYAPPDRLPAIKFEQAIAPGGPDPSFFQDKIVVIGARPSVGPVGSEQDQYANPYSRFGGDLASGATLHALSLLNLLRQDWLVRWPSLAELSAIVLLGALTGFFLTRCRLGRAGLLALAGCVALVTGGFALHWFAQQWLAWMIMAGVQIPLALAWAVAFSAVCDYRDKGILCSTLAVHFSPARVKQVLHHPELLRPGAARREVSLLMTDIQSFSKVTALMHPEDMVQLLNAYYELAIDSIYQTEGTVMDLVGDSIFALWNAPDTQADHRERAYRTALHLQQVLREFDAKNPGLPLRTRLGVHAGPVWVGNIGSSRRFDYAALGEAVNVTSRLEALNKWLGTEILATREIQRAAPPAQASRLVGHFAFQGIDQPIEVHELLGATPFPSDGLWQATFAQALHDFQRREFAQAKAGFRMVLQARPQDGPSLFYSRTIDELDPVHLPPGWLGIIQLDGK